MKKLLRAILCLLVVGGLVVGGLLAAGVVSLHSLLDFAPGESLSSALENGAQLYSQMADHHPPSGEGELLEGDLPADLVPDASSLYSFPEKLYPYRAMLTPAEQSAYDQVYANAMELYDQLPLHTPVSVDSIVRAVRAVFYDHPELFWVNTDYRYSYLSEDSVVAVTLSFNETAGDIGAHRARFERAAQEVIQGARALETAVEQEKYVHDYLLDNVSYQLDSPLNQSAYSALIYGETVCAGYSRAFQYILLELGIPCYYCSGYAGESHAWNIVGLEDGYYHVDVTWDDPLGNESGTRYYNYFNLTDQEIAADHTRTDLSQSLPACTATGYSYVNVFGEPETYATSLRTLEEIGFAKEHVIYTMDDYYGYCENRLAELGEGTHTFSMVLGSRHLIDQVLKLTESGEAVERYVSAAAERLGFAGYSANVSLQGEGLEDGYWLLTQQVHLESRGYAPAEEQQQEPEPEPPASSQADGEDPGQGEEDQEAAAPPEPPEAPPAVDPDGEAEENEPNPDREPPGEDEIDGDVPRP